ncbi:carboxypeptidase-like regulatory domain-containing protein [Tenacibaculum retecalamus]|uniref:carboxypeptidase-like regulatory domain-containing protein n=1 Tax=Tenacibaculum retecalamus TaxID=3018315 RepID=UPI0023D95174|nr:carboxypeptidase-like regulatory domain-containing protein [Tenacibaculum retecalamus]WBX72285.1 carboxypeptidase-like regulatory domain-containing protein [Tenacibaculum retecalamus]
MNKRLLFLVLLISFLKAQSQENRKFLYADVKDKVGHVFNAHVVNLNTKQGTFTNESGEFRILAKQHDSLQISFVGYKSTLLIVNLHHFGIQKNTFELVKTAFELDEISIKKNNLLGYLTSDSKNIKIEKKIDAKTLKLPYAGSRILTPAERRLYTAMGGRNLLSIDYIINSISGRITKLRKLKTIESLEVKVKNLKNTYSKHIVKEYQIKESDVYKFIYFCTADEHFNQVYNSGDINMILFLKKKSEVFKKLHSNNYN